ncbi:tRNA pseudouridine(38-40) synthase TruA [Persicitalea jodogahamensis]|uniref:tRNA pseudouridine synthase A n=1 Tax=Persicitalea jodogahamensis TaxID=402147 RepID=A0A8J3D318_9BACT|nr:tRNA pseudouridine(38-40) synthase TruA [Persicitalea jodogahamensis]GHB73675.1 tRNA pseudouridine synthase A [Persicitalea jodogahamensis]
MRYFIQLSYKGTDFIGWQRQVKGRSVQQTLEEALSTILRQPIEIVGSSRTDAGVHASQQFAHFDLEKAIPDPGMVVYRMNSLLPNDLAVRAIFLVGDDIHARFAATHRRYEYRIIRQKNPFLINEAYVFRPELDLQKMNAAAALLLQHDDFESFSKVHTDVKTFICNIVQAEWFLKDEVLCFSVQSNRFLRGMVRGLVGTLLEVGTNKLTVAEFEKIILAKNRQAAGPQAPAKGLFLVEVGYEESVTGSRQQAVDGPH